MTRRRADKELSPCASEEAEGINIHAEEEATGRPRWRRRRRDPRRRLASIYKQTAFCGASPFDEWLQFGGGGGVHCHRASALIGHSAAAPTPNAICRGRRSPPQSHACACALAFDERTLWIRAFEYGAPPSPPLHHQKNKTKHQRRFVDFCKQSHPRTAIFKLHSDPHLNLGIKPNLKFLCQNLTFERPESQSEKKSSFECRSKALPRKSQPGILLRFASKESKKHSNIQRQSKI